ncbi:ORF3 [Bemisia tabaci arlivirus 2]|uniref:ORF3 n=1 Tax=Bemisia tabaci arlivirus 2 TaxID=2840018 RepID=A0A8E8KS00_9MONO|nr:ORF3 [Bemisia tabaci arlivirus 2]QWC36463.1 ORF3 [Bemisia tabaci arlivirus 2]
MSKIIIHFVIHSDPLLAGYNFAVWMYTSKLLPKDINFDRLRTTIMGVFNRYDISFHDRALLELELDVGGEREMMEQFHLTRERATDRYFPQIAFDICSVANEPRSKFNPGNTYQVLISRIQIVESYGPCGLVWH